MLGISAYLLSFLFVAFIGQRLPVKRACSFETAASFLLLFVFFGFRDLPILNDTAHYYGHFWSILESNWQSILDIDSSDRFEIGYQVFERIIASLSDNPYSIILISALIITVSNLLFIREYTSHIAISAFFFLTQMILLFQYSAIRQALAISLFYLAISQLIKRRIIVYAILIVIASTFHSSAWILLIIPIIIRIPFKTQNIVLFLIITILVSVFMAEIIDLMGLGTSDYIERDLHRETTAFGVLLQSLMMVILLVSSVSILRKTGISDIDRIFLWISLLGLVFSLLSYKLMIVGRFACYFTPFTSLCFIRAVFRRDFSIEGAKTTHPFLLYTVSFVLFLQILIVLKFRPEWYHLIPYSFYDFNVLHSTIDFGY